MNVEIIHTQPVKVTNITPLTLEDQYTALVDEAGFYPDGMKFLAFEFIKNKGLDEEFLVYLNKELLALKEEMKIFDLQVKEELMTYDELYE